ncbi:hypothetical protein EGW08_014155 [Elysia chlorotica]|uniref:Uncharacterized protein n=1 Tax=Elysia chlorotica TaxID=188477 RepID=A0A3S1B946_ELYCH|nr:hypothetical protein EGW08_014155 [Elysia chlorotica]
MVKEVQKDPIMLRMRSLGIASSVVYLAVYLACVCEGMDDTVVDGMDDTVGEGMVDTVGEVKRDSTQKSGFGKRKSRNDCDELRDMFVEQGCIIKDSRRCRLLNFRLEGGRLSKRPRCEFMPCERYDQPANQTCQSFCFGTTVPGGLCESGKVCCVPGPRPTTTTTKTCGHQCVSAFDCLEVDSYSSCGQFSLDVCCRTVGSRGFYSQSNSGGGVDNLLSSRSLFSGGFGNFLQGNGFAVYDSPSDPFYQNGGQYPPAPQPPKPRDNSEVQPLPCPYTCLPANACGDVDPASNAITCGGYPYVCCRIALPPTVAPTPAPTEGGQCPFECVRSNKCVEEADSVFSCGNRKVCCKTTKRDEN